MGWGTPTAPATFAALAFDGGSATEMSTLWGGTDFRFALEDARGLSIMRPAVLPGAGLFYRSDVF